MSPFILYGFIQLVDRHMKGSGVLVRRLSTLSFLCGDSVRTGPHVTSVKVYDTE